MKLLIIDDNQKLLKNLKKIITRQKNIVDTATDGKEGLEKGSSTKYDVIVLDLRLPKLDGIEVCKELRKRGIITPVIMLTARDTLEDRVQGLDSGADDYLVKPFGTQELLARIRSLIRRNGLRAQTTPTLKARDLELNPITHRVTRSGKDIPLSLKEYNLLEFLLRYAGETISQKELLEHLWDNHTKATSNHLAVFVRYLRRKIDDPYRQKLIGTVKGFGYKINVP
jgi:DNA-binding response OmpR family regulator